MKKLFLILTISFFSFQVQGQEDNQLYEMITSSIDSFITNEKRLVKQGSILMDTCRFNLCRDVLPEDYSYKGKLYCTFSLPNVEGMPNWLKHELKKGIEGIFVGLKISNNQIVVLVNERRVKLLKKGNLSITMINRCAYAYEYSCEKKKWILVNHRYEGV